MTWLAHVMRNNHFSHVAKTVPTLIILVFRKKGTYTLQLVYYVKL